MEYTFEYPNGVSKTDTAEAIAKALDLAAADGTLSHGDEAHVEVIDTKEHQTAGMLVIAVNPMRGTP